MKDKIKRVLCLCDYATQSGYAVVSKEIIRRLNKQFYGKIKIDIVAIGYWKEAYDETSSIRVMPASKGMFTTNAGSFPDDVFGRLKFCKLLLEGDYDLAFIIQDLGVVHGMIMQLQQVFEERKQQNKRIPKTAYYFPVDGHILPEWAEMLPFFDMVLPYTHFAENEILKHVALEEEKVRVIYHGIDEKKFFHIEDKKIVKEFRDAYFKEHSDKFIIANINRNNPRKNIPATLAAFAELIKLKEGFSKTCVLYLHMNPLDHIGHNLLIVCQYLGLEVGKNVLFPNEDFISPGFSTEEMNLIYKSCDMMVNTTSGEGFGLTMIEAMATKLPILSMVNTALTELWCDEIHFPEIEGKRFERISPPYMPYITHMDNNVRTQPYNLHLANQLFHFSMQCKTPDEDHEEIIHNAHKFAHELTWDNVYRNHWRHVFQKLLK